jgi:hypothetical protein
MLKIEGKATSYARPDPKIERDRKERQRMLKLLHEYRDRNPDCVIPDEFLLAHPAWLNALV